MTDDKTIETILTECKKLQDVLNNHFIKEFCKLHNISENVNRFSLKQEVIAKRGLFIMKKKYILWIINSEGVPVSEYDVKGVSIKRAEFPAITKTKMAMIIDYLLKDETISFIKIRKFIEDTKNEIKALCLSNDKAIANTVSYSKKLDDYKIVPGHVRAMEMWNNLEYDYFTAGTRGYLFRIKGIDFHNAPNRVQSNINKYEKNEYIAVPYEEDKLPDYYNIDIDRTMKYAWDDRVDELVGALKSEIFKIKKVEAGIW